MEHCCSCSDLAALRLPENFTVTVNTTFHTINSEGTIKIWATSNFTIMPINTGTPGSTLGRLSFTTVVADIRQASMNTVINAPAGNVSFFGFSAATGASGFYQGNVAAVPELASMLP